MNKLIIIPILFVLAFSQNVDNQISYTIYTDTKSYPDVTLLSVQGKGLIVNEKNGTRKYNIYIPYINRINIIEGGSNPIRKPLRCVFGLSLGAVGGGLIGFGLYSQSSGYAGTKTYASGYAGLIVPFTILGTIDSLTFPESAGKTSTELVKVEPEVRLELRITTFPPCKTSTSVDWSKRSLTN